MRVYKVAWLLFKNNIKLYKFYIFVLACTSAVYYNFLAVYYNPYVTAMESRLDFARIAGWMSSLSLFFVLLFFMNHVNTFFYKERSKEIATYMLMGIKKKQIGKVLAMESVIVGAIGLGIGVLIGLVFSKLFFMVLGSQHILGVKIPFYFSGKAVIVLVMIMSSILGVLAIRNMMLVQHEKLIELLNTNSRGGKYAIQYADKQSLRFKLKFLIGVIGLGCIGLGYYYTNDILHNLLQVMGLICIGTYLVFSGFFPLLLLKAIQNKKLSYRKMRLISLSNILFRLESNYRSYAATAILSAATLTALMTSLSVRQFERDNLKYEIPYSLSYISGDEEVHKKVMEKIKLSKHEVLEEVQVHFIKVLAKRDIGGGFRDEEILIVPFSEMKANIEGVHLSGKAKLIESIQPREEGGCLILRASVALSTWEKEQYKIGQQVFSVANVIRAPFVGKMPNLSTYDTLVVSDEVYEQLKNTELTEEYCLNNINFSKQEESIELVTTLMRIIPDYKNKMITYVEGHMRKYYIMGAFYFIGMILSLIFILTVFSTIYFKCLSDAQSDKKQYDILRRLGVSKASIKRSICMQNSMAVILPALVGMVHGLVAIRTLEDFMHLSFLESKLIGIGLFSMVMLFFFGFINRKYVDRVSKKEV